MTSYADRIVELEDRVRVLENVCRQARACLLNLQPEEKNPLQRQMQKMVGELSVVLGDIELAPKDSKAFTRSDIIAVIKEFDLTPRDIKEFVDTLFDGSIDKSEDTPGDHPLQQLGYEMRQLGKRLEEDDKKGVINQSPLQGAVEACLRYFNFDKVKHNFPIEDHEELLASMREEAETELRNAVDFVCRG